MITFSWKDLTLWLLTAMAALLLRAAAGSGFCRVTASSSGELSAFLSLEAAAKAPGLQETQMGRERMGLQGREEAFHPQGKAWRKGGQQRARRRRRERRRRRSAHGWVQVICWLPGSSETKSRQDTENATPYLIRSLCNISAVGPAKVQGL